MNAEKLYIVCRELFPDLENVALPDAVSDFAEWIDWLNTNQPNIQYVELNEFFDNGVEECAQFDEQQRQKLEEKINAELNIFLDNFDEDSFDPDEAYDTTYDILFNNITHVAKAQNMTVLVINTENPYWMVVPNHQEKVQTLLQLFNSIFENDELKIGEHQL